MGALWGRLSAIIKLSGTELRQVGIASGSTSGTNYECAAKRINVKSGVALRPPQRGCRAGGPRCLPPHSKTDRYRSRRYVRT